MRTLLIVLLLASPVAAEPEQDPFTFADFTWQSGSARTKDAPLATEHITPELRLDDVFHYSFNHPADDTIGGSTAAWRSGENQITQLGFGGDVHVDRVQLLLMTQFGQLATTTPRSDPSPARGQWQLADMYRYLSEAYGGYHLGDPHRGVNIQAGLFMSYVGLWSYYNFDNWTYQPSFVSSNTPWFFNGMRVQWFVSDRLKIEPWLVNGWQAYGRINHWPGLGAQIRYAPSGSVIFALNQYALGADTPGDPDRHRYHSDDSVQVKWFEDRSAWISRVATTLTLDAGCEQGGAVRCSSQYFLGFMAYVRTWHGEHLAATFGGGAITNPGRYLVLLPPINGATAASGTPYFSEAPGDPWASWDTQLSLDVMPSDYLTVRAEVTYRHASVPYFTGPGGVTPPGGNQGAPGSLVQGWSPDLVRDEPRATLALLIKI
jgi:hypothetical protein